MSTAPAFKRRSLLPSPSRPKTEEEREAEKQAEIKSLLEAAKTLSENLNSATDELNAALESAEDVLASLNLGVTASVTLTSVNEPDGSTWFRDLAFKKSGSRWKLVVETGYDGVPDSWQETDLLSSSREIRQEAVSHLPKLLKALVRQANLRIAAVKKCTAEVSAFVSAIRNAGGGL